MSQENWKQVVSLFIILTGVFLNYRKAKKKRTEENEFDSSVSDAEDLVSPVHWLSVLITKYIPSSFVGVVLILYGVWLFFR